MAEQRYRFGGPIPESVQTLRARRRYRGSESFATLKKNRRQDFWANPPAGWEQEHDDWGGVIGIRRALPAESAEARSVTYRFLEDEKDRVLADPGAPAAPSTAGAERAPSPLSAEQVEAFEAAFLGRPGAVPFPWLTQPGLAPADKPSGATARLRAAITRACRSLRGDRGNRSPDSSERALPPEAHPLTPRLPSLAPSRMQPGSSRFLPPAPVEESE